MGKVLVVDDQRDIADLYKIMIDTVGHNCIVTCSGEEALEQIKTIKFNLILLDISMPGMDGIELIKRIKKEPNASGANIVFITASIPPDHDIDTLKKLGAKTVLMKPAKKKEMIEMITQYIDN